MTAHASTPCFRRLFIANRGEVAVRIAKACDELGIEVVFGVSKADLEAPYLENRERVVLGPGSPGRSYLDAESIVQAARQTRCTALHPGWGFLSERPSFVRLCEQHGVSFIGPPAHVMDLMGRKIPAKRAMAAAGVAVIPGSEGVLSGVDEARSVAREVGYPVLLKAESGGGGRGMRIAKSPDQLEQAYHDAQAEARAAFGDDRLYLEHCIEGGRHIEIQIIADRYGKVLHLGERDCSVQRNHQKLVEEAPAPGLDPDERTRTLEAALAACRRIGYVGAGTLEFLLGSDGRLRFMEMNTRLQVEHGVSEMLTGIDLVAAQIRVAAGQPLPWSQVDISLDGHAIECRINAEEPREGFRPTPGKITQWQLPAALDNQVRIDTHVQTGYVVPPYYDSLLCKILVRGQTRDEARQRMLTALREFECSGVPTTKALHQAIMASESFAANTHDTRTIPGWSLEDNAPANN